MENSIMKFGKGEVLMLCHAGFLDNLLGVAARGFY